MTRYVPVGFSGESCGYQSGAFARYFGSFSDYTVRILFVTKSAKIPFIIFLPLPMLLQIQELFFAQINS